MRGGSGSEHRPGAQEAQASSSDQTSSNTVLSPKSLEKATYIAVSDCSSPPRVNYGPTEKGVFLPPESAFVTAFRWMLLNEPVFAPGRDITTEGSYLRARGARHVQWRSDASFRAVHSVVAEAVEFEREPLGTMNTVFVCVAATVALMVAILGCVVSRDYRCAVAAAIPPLFYAIALVHVWRARRQASLQMARCAFERERAVRMRARPPVRRYPEVIVHHVILAFLEDILEFCKYGELPGPGIAHAWGWGERSESACPDAAAAAGLRGHPDCTHPAFEKPMQCPTCSNCTACFGMHAFTRWLTLAGPLETLRNANEYVHENVGVSMFKYDWHTDAALRLAAVAKAEGKMCLHARFGSRSLSIIAAGLTPSILLMCASTALVSTGYMYVYIPALVTSSVFLLVSVTVLLRRLPAWKIVDGLIGEARGRLERGDAGLSEVDEITQVTDIAVRALDLSLLAMNDRGEQQSCEYWPLTVDDGPPESFKVFEGLDEASLTPSERHQSLRDQISLQLQYASAERHQYIRQNSPPFNMRAYDNALALDSQERPVVPSLQAMDGSGHFTSYHRMEHNTEPQVESFQAPLKLQGMAPKPASRGATCQWAVMDASGVQHARVPSKHTRMPSLGHLVSEPSLQDMQSSQPSFSSNSSTQKMSSAFNVEGAAGSGLEPTALAPQERLAPPVHVPLQPISSRMSRSKSQIESPHFLDAANSPSRDLHADNEEETAALPGVPSASKFSSPAFWRSSVPVEQEMVGVASAAAAAAAAAPRPPNPELPLGSTCPDDGASVSGSTFVTAMGTPGASSVSALESAAGPAAKENSFWGRSGASNAGSSKGASGAAPLAGGRDSKGNSGPSKGSSAHHVTALSTLPALPDSPTLRESAADAAEPGYSAGCENSESLCQAQSSAIDSIALPPVSLGMGAVPEPTPAVNFKGKPAVGAYAAAPFNVQAYADAHYSTSHVPAAAPGTLGKGPASGANNTGLLPGSQLVVGPGGEGGKAKAGEGLPVPFSAESTRRSPQSIVP